VARCWRDGERKERDFGRWELIQTLSEHASLFRVVFDTRAIYQPGTSTTIMNEWDTRSFTIDALLPSVVELLFK
jgi:hypothetical protein